jgi:hypothetical protein
MQPGLDQVVADKLLDIRIILDDKDIGLFHGLCFLPGCFVAGNAGWQPTFIAVVFFRYGYGILTGTTKVRKEKEALNQILTLVLSDSNSRAVG